MPLNPGLALPFGIQPVNPLPVDTYSGPYTGSNISEAIFAATSSIPLAIRFQTMQVRLLIGTAGNYSPYIYWFQNGINDVNLVNFQSGSGGGSGATGPIGPTGPAGVGYGFIYNALYNQSPHFQTKYLVTDGVGLDDVSFFYLSSRDFNNVDLEVAHTVFSAIKQQMLIASPSGNTYFTVKVYDYNNPTYFQALKLLVSDFTVIPGATGGAILNNLIWIGGGLSNPAPKVVVSFEMPAGDTGQIGPTGVQGPIGPGGIQNLQDVLTIGNTANIGYTLYDSPTTLIYSNAQDVYTNRDAYGHYVYYDGNSSNGGIANVGGQFTLYNYNTGIGGSTLLYFINNTPTSNFQYFQDKSGTIALLEDIKIYQLPVPNVQFITMDKRALNLYCIDITTGSEGDRLPMTNVPIVTAIDFTQEQLDNTEIYVEMVHYKRKHRIGSQGFYKTGYVAPGSWTEDPDNPGEFGNFSPWGQKFWTRSGAHHYSTNFNITMARPNHYRVNKINETIPVYEYLNGMFTQYDIAYRRLDGHLDYVNCIIPMGSRRKAGSNKPTNRYAYSPYFTPMYVAFRYIIWDSTANEGRGQIISGPLSKIVKITTENFPFTPDYVQSSVIGAPVVSISTGFEENNSLKCWFETRLP